MIELISIDMDGTLLDVDHWTIPQKNIEAINMAVEKGIKIYINTGRLIEDVQDFAIRYCLNCGMICCNGAVAYEKAAEQNELLFESTFDREAIEIIEYLIQYPLVIHAFERGKVTTVAKSESEHYHLFYRNLIKESRGKDAIIKAASRYLYKIYAYKDRDRIDSNGFSIEEIRDNLIQIFPHLEVTSSSRNVLEIMPKGTTKGNALEKIAKKLGISSGSIMAIGDADNDLDMLSYAGYSVAMANSSDKVIESCQFITSTNYECGVAEAINYAINQNNSLCVSKKMRIDKR